jgi:very-short-patch-repair endonuclease
VVLGRFIVHFATVGARIVVEVDGGYHASRRVADARCDDAIARLGYRMVRLDAALVLEHPMAAIANIREALAAST